MSLKESFIVEGEQYKGDLMRRFVKHVLYKERRWVAMEVKRLKMKQPRPQGFLHFAKWRAKESWTRRAAILKIVDEKTLGTRLKMKAMTMMLLKAMKLTLDPKRSVTCTAVYVDSKLTLAVIRLFARAWKVFCLKEAVTKTKEIFAIHFLFR